MLDFFKPRRVQGTDVEDRGHHQHAHSKKRRLSAADRAAVPVISLLDDAGTPRQPLATVQAQPPAPCVAAAAPAVSAAAAADRGHPPGAGSKAYDAQHAQLEAMGFPAFQAQLALRVSKGDVQRAAEWLLASGASS